MADAGGAEVRLRDMTADDLPVLFEQQRDPVANRMAAFTSRDPEDRDAFTAHWTKILADESITKKVIVDGETVVGSVVSFERDGVPEVTYWIGREHWGRGYASRGLAALLEEVTLRPLHARVAKDNVGSIRVLEKCGFSVTGDDKGFSSVRGEEVEEYILTLEANDPRCT